MASPKVITPVSEFTTPVLTPGTGQDANEATFEAAFQILANRTEFLNDNLGGGPALAANQVFGKKSTGVAEGKTATDFSFGVLALATAVAHADAIHTKGGDIASATTTNIAGATGDYVHITGTVTITGFGTAAAGVTRTLRFAGILTLTHNATSLILPGGTNITTAANDTAIAVSEGAGNWRVIAYQKATGDSVFTDAESIRTVNLDLTTVGSPPDFAVLAFDSVDYKAALLVDANIDAAAAIVVSKLAAGASNTVLKSGDGAEWSLLGNDSISASADIAVTKIVKGTADQVFKTNGAGTSNEFGLLANANIDGSAAIAGSKIVPDFAAQTIITTGDIAFGAAATAPLVTQTAVVDAVGKTLSVLGQGNNSASNKAGDIVIGGGVNAGAGDHGDTVLQRIGADVFKATAASTTIDHPTDLIFNIAASTVAAVNAGAFSLAVPLLEFAQGQVAPVIKQAAETTNSVDGDDLTIEAQSAEGTTADGGDLILKPGTGTDNDGDVQVGLGTAQLEIDGILGTMGLYTAVPVIRQTITGARNTEEAFTELMTKLALWGAVNDSTTIQTASVADTSTSNAITFDFSVNRTRVLVMTEDTTASITDPPNVGDRQTIIVKQDASGSGWVITWPGANWIWTNGAAPTLPVAADAVSVITTVWDGTDHHVTLQPDGRAEKQTLTMVIPDLSVDGTYTLALPACTIAKIRSTIDGALLTADSVLTGNINGVAITNGVVTITQSGSAQYDTDEATPTAANVATAGQVLELVIADSQSASIAAHIAVEIEI